MTKTSLFLLLTLFCTQLLADDISAIAPMRAKPNILLVLDYSNSMNGKIGGVRKIESLKAAVNSVIDNYSKDINIGVGSLFHQEAGGIQWPVSDLREPARALDSAITDTSITGLDVVKNIVNTTPLQFGTATFPALVEASLYFKGMNLSLGGVDQRNAVKFKPRIWENSTRKYVGGSPLMAHRGSFSPASNIAFQGGGAPGSTGYCRQYDDRYGPQFCEGIVTDSCSFVGGGRWQYDQCEYSHSDIWSGAQYKSPADTQCQSNFIILVSDGKPHDVGAEKEFEDITGMPYASCEDLVIRFGAFAAKKGNCSPELAAYMYANDVDPSIPGSNVITHTVAFGINDWGKDFLEGIATAGGGQFFNSSGASDLSAALAALFDSAKSPVDSVSTFAIDVDRASASNDDRAYLPLIVPSANKSWRGNLKGYFLGSGGLKDISNTEATEVGPDGLTFKDTAQSFWSDAPDGAHITSGGANGELNPAGRNLYTYTESAASIPLSGVALATSSEYLLDKANPQLLASHFGPGSDRDFLLEQIRAQPMGDPLHGDVVVANYAGGERVLFVGTNQGFLHAIDASEPGPSDFNNFNGGKELFAFMPKELLPNVNFMFAGGFSGEHIYGLDGNIVPVHTDFNSDGIVNGADTFVLVIGMRRGGSNYYALDVTNPNSPRLKWQINGGAGAFADLAQSWSRPAVVTVKKGSSSEKILMFAGGYDDTRDDMHTRGAASGNSVYFVDVDGALIWSASHPSMKYSIPSDISVLDLDANGDADRLYVGDLGGQIWRIDFDDVDRAGDYRVELFADLSASGYQPFFYPPSVALQSSPDGSQHLAVVVGSGNRDNPRSDFSRSALYMLTDPSTDNSVASRSTGTLVRSDLYNATSADLQSSTLATAQAARAEFALKEGWYMESTPGRKYLSDTVILDGTIMATTYYPTPSTDHCGIPSSANNFIAVDIDDAGPAAFFGGDDPLDSRHPRDKRYRLLETAGIASSPQLVFVKGSENVQIYVGKEKVEALPQALNKMYWYSK